MVTRSKLAESAKLFFDLQHSFFTYRNQRQPQYIFYHPLEVEDAFHSSGVTFHKYQMHKTFEIPLHLVAGIQGIAFESTLH